ncbi:MAG: HNH endonuclease [Candidatus Brocadiia bacterium]
MLLEQPTLVLNRSWVPVFTIPVRKSIIWLCRDIARVVDAKDYSLHDLHSWADLSKYSEMPALSSPSIRLVAPEVVKMVRYNNVPKNRVPFTRRALFLRDRFTCQYCGATPGARELTIDHLVPLSRGGRSNWDNCALACVPCNTRKSNRTPEESGMSLKRKPDFPKWSPIYNVSPSRVLSSWQHFISDAYWNVVLEEE